MQPIVVDLFAGGGGTSLGLEWALGRVDVAVNHDPEAVAMHATNHPGTRHFCEDVHAVPPLYATQGRPVRLLWASPDCTHHSKAKGGAPNRDVARRGLAWVVEKWAAAVQPWTILLENVEEWRDWGPLDSAGRPVVAHKGDTFRAFCRRLRRLGYRIESHELMACDYGAPTIRKRMFLVAQLGAARPIVWPKPSHGEGLIPYRTAAECIDWWRPCPSIFSSAEEILAMYGLRVKRPLVENTMRRIAKGVVRYVLNHPDPFVISYYGRDTFRGQLVDEPLRTQTVENRFGLVAPYIHNLTHGQRAEDMREPMRTITCAHRGEKALVAASLMTNTTGHAPGDPRQPMPTVTTGNQQSVVAAFLAQHNAGFCRTAGRDPRDPMSTISCTGSQQQLVAAHLVRDFGQSVGRDARQPAGTITATGFGKTGLAVSSLVNLRGQGRGGRDVREPLPTLTAQGNHLAEVRAFLCKYYGQGGQWQDCRDPMHTLTTKARMGLVTVAGQVQALADIGMRMFQPRELYRANGFPDTYVIDPVVYGKPLTKTAQVRMCGNCVPPQFSRALALANCVNVEARAAA